MDTGSLGGREVRRGTCAETAEEELQAVSADSLSESFAAERGREMGRGGQTDESALPRRAIAGAGAHLSLPQFPRL